MVKELTICQLESKPTLVECISLTVKHENHAYYIFGLYMKLKEKLFEKPNYLKYDILFITFRGS